MDNVFAKFNGANIKYMFNDKEQYQKEETHGGTALAGDFEDANALPLSPFDAGALSFSPFGVGALPLFPLAALELINVKSDKWSQQLKQTHTLPRQK